jgi:flavin-dependent dehydrogenase
MERCDVLIVGGGPAGSTCAWSLRRAGLDVIVMDKAAFPRDKTCAGWITPAVVDLLDLDVGAYRQQHVFQPITGFRTGLMGRPLLETYHDYAVSYGIRRCEFDDYLLRRSGARLRLEEPLDQLVCQRVTQNPADCRCRRSLLPRRALPGRRGRTQ